MDALLTGQLVADEDAGVAIQAADGTTIVVVWPHGGRPSTRTTRASW